MKLSGYVSLIRVGTFDRGCRRLLGGLPQTHSKSQSCYTVRFIADDREGKVRLFDIPSRNNVVLTFHGHGTTILGGEVIASHPVRPVEKLAHKLGESLFSRMLLAPGGSGSIPGGIAIRSVPVPCLVALELCTLHCFPSIGLIVGTIGIMGLVVGMRPI